MRTTILVGLFGLVACNGDKTTTTSGETGTTTDTQTTDTTTGGGGFAITGTAITLAQTPAAEGLCASVVDPTPALTGGAPLTLVTGTVGAAGALSFTDVVTTSTIGLLIDIRDCATVTAPTAYPSATGISAASYAGLGAGDTLSGQTAFSLDIASFNGFAASAGAAGYAGDLGADGFLMGFVFDAGGTPIDGATVTCTGVGCPSPWYLDADSADGLFTTAAALNTATSAAAGAGFIFPAAPIAQYGAEDGGTHTFTPQLNGSNPGIATFTAIYAD